MEKIKTKSSVLDVINKNFYCVGFTKFAVRVCCNHTDESVADEFDFLVKTGQLVFGVQRQLSIRYITKSEDDLRNRIISCLRVSGVKSLDSSSVDDCLSQWLGCSGYKKEARLMIERDLIRLEHLEV